VGSVSTGRRSRRANALPKRLARVDSISFFASARLMIATIISGLKMKSDEQRQI
jgi:hypothetical protein